MSLSAEGIEFTKDIPSELGPLTPRKMMGGLCLYLSGTIFATSHPDFGVMIKGGGPFQAELDAMGLTRWTYQRSGSEKTTAMPYWKLPETALDDPQ